MKKLTTETILTTIFAPLLIGGVFWFFSFVLSSYQLRSEVEGQSSDIQEIKQDVKDIRSFLIKDK
jgi:TRAP-type C4-dicarboxylate transport system permease small subunit